MAKHKFNKTFARLLREIVKLFKTLTGQFMRWFLRTFFVAGRWGQRQAGFVLPTTVFMLLAVGLIVTAIMFRTFTRSSQVIRQGQVQIINNAATPAVQRAKSKIEYLFNDNPSADVPNEIDLENKLLNFGDFSRSPDPYTFTDETRISDPAALGLAADVPGGTAWTYQTDTNGDGDVTDDNDLTTIYAIVSRAERPTISIDPAKTAIYNKDEKRRADAFIVRNGPLASLQGTTSQNCPISVAGNESGWFAGTSTAQVNKAFQVYAITVPNAVANRKATSNTALATIEYQQDRKYERINKWGAWFRYDMEIAPGPRFNWNGAMHSQGNMFVRSFSGFRSYLISAEGSCLYKPFGNSSLTMRKPVEAQNPGDVADPGGQMIAGTIRDNEFKPDIVFIDNKPNDNDAQSIKLVAEGASGNQSADSVRNIGTPISISTDPLSLHTQGIAKARVPQAPNSWQENDTFWGTGDSAGPLRPEQEARVDRAASCAPYVDDTYRADNRYGPKPSYDKEESTNGVCVATPEPNAIAGASIPPGAATDRLTRDNPIPGDLERATVGLDGYWERRARSNGLRLIVGQRLELGNPFGWNVDLNDSDGDNNFTNDTSNPTGTPPTTPLPADGALYPPNGENPNLPARINEGRQYVTLRDNLAAVQTTAVYHHTFGDTAGTPEPEGGFFPIAFVASTVHPATQKTLRDSTTFKNPTPFNTTTTYFGAGAQQQFGNDNNEILSNFFLGEGTNGWEFSVVPVPNGTPSPANQTEATFEALVENQNSPLRRALNNLALFAGDPEGAFPPRQEPAPPAANKVTHPYSNLTMWGNFSNLRETLGLLGTNYQNLSIADKSTLHTAAGTLGMLGYNISYLQEFDYTTPTTADTNPNKKLLTDLDTRLAKLSETTAEATRRNNGGEIEVTTVSGRTFIDVYQNSTTPVARVKINPAAPQATPPEAFIAALEAQVENVPPADKVAAETDLQMAKLIHLKEQVKRDRNFGFRETPTTPGVYQYTVARGNFPYAGLTYNVGDDINLGCNFSTASGNNYFGFGAPTDAPSEQRFIRLATSLCPTQPKFPSLYYLFPTYNHRHQGEAVPNSVPPGATANEYLQPGNEDITDTLASPAPPAEPYVTDPYISSNAVNGGNTTLYQVVGGIANPNDLTGVALKPRTLITTGARCTQNNWCLPASSTITNRVNRITDHTTNANATEIAIPFLDKAMFDGRELINTRVLDIDLDMIRRERVLTTAQDTWLPKSGLVYAFREDAVREDAIARPALSDWTTYQNAWNTSANPGDPEAANRIMQLSPLPADPPVSADLNISPKPVDYYADPDRRPYGFRLKNGLDLRRFVNGSVDATGTNGLSFISDNPVYIQGDFNPHSTNGTVNNSNLLEEFNTKLTDSYSNFYSRGTSSSNLNTDFARPRTDTWRPTEIIADAVNILSNTFCDGTIQSGIRGTNEGCTTGTVGTGTPYTSYRNSHLQGDPTTPSLSTTANEGYICENPFDIRRGAFANPNRKGCEGPIKVFRNGDIQYVSTAGTVSSYTRYRAFAKAEGRNLNRASTTRVNTVLISGIVPSRVQQSNGGMHNFPRLIEDWGGDTSNTPLWFSGSMIQLNFSNYATAPYDQDAWETPRRPQGGGNTGEWWSYYNPAPRRWGYDVGLQYAPAGAVSRRMVNLARERNEVYREPKADDPYICKLRQAINYPCS
ncbi:hormogonium polysaccharide biosynthesis protein HpsA [Microcoleus sp. FACHB-68]|uniref:hormogonium polysaccharide biosynthesis protein HpsA n=1 Tax=Microcoleus sp. FACHB-68 TaxID=2692826 RepID=UPI0016866B52|nr:hormogonium polysaccharide biosynthesis protein HpsA [Microcoleus sp. FACHB-68]MBD1940484.1 hypothetical protein [Microcoleus sp. FACHB-68]